LLCAAERDLLAIAKFLVSYALNHESCCGYNGMTVQKLVHEVRTNSYECGTKTSTWN